MHVSPSTLTDRELLKRYHEEGDASAREALVQRHLPLVRSLARRYAGRGEALDDIEQVGAIGLIKAIDRYELSRDVALTTYATPNVAGEFERTDDRTSLEPALARLPPREREILRMRFEEGLTQTQIADQIGISQMHVSRLIRRSLDRMRDQLT